MKAYLTTLLKQFDGRSVRERILIGLTLFAVTWAIWIASIGGIVLDNKAEVITSIDRLAADLQMQQDERERLKRQDTAPMLEALEEQEARLQKLILDQQQELDGLLTRFVPPENVPQLLEDVLSDHDGLTLIRLSSKPAEPLILQAAAENPETVVDGDKAPHVEIYRHPVQLEFEGGYMDVLAYLLALEGGDWQFAWRKFEYTVEDYPTAQVLIEVETLSREKEWLGV